MATERMDKIDALIKRVLAQEIAMIFPELIIAVTQVHVTKDLSHSKIWITSPINPELALKKCQSSATDLRKYLAGHIVARKVPALHFVLDETYENVERIEKLVREIRET